MKIKGKKIFITGGAGFIASHFIDRVIASNEVIIFDNLHRNALQYTDLAKHKNLKFIKGDILDVNTLENSLHDIDIFIHMAAIAGVNSIVKRPSTTLRINLIGSYNALNACKKKNIGRFINFSTSEVYGPNVYGAVEDGMTTLGAVGKPRWTYAMSKLASEFLGYSFFKEDGIKFTSIRPFNVYGPRQVGEGAMHNFILKAIKNEQIIIYKPGTQVRSWCYIDDLINGMIKVIENDRSIGEIFNIGNPQATSTTLRTAETIIRLAKSKSRLKFENFEYPEIEIRVPNVEKAERILGFKAIVGFEEGIKRTIEWYKKNLK